MGQQCCVEERKSNRVSMVSKALNDEIEYVREMSYCQRRRQLLLYEDRPIIDLLSQIDISEGTPTTGNLVSEKGTINDFDQYERMSSQIVEQIQELCKQNITSDWILLCDNKDSVTSLKLHIKQIETTDNTKINATCCQFLVPCKPEAFVEFMGHFQKQKDLDPRIDSFFPVKKNEETNELTIYLSYKPILMTSARDFLYYKKSKQIDQQNNIWCDASKSITDPQYPVRQKIRGEIILSGYIVQPLANVIADNYYKNRFSNLSCENYSIVNMYSECDFKMSIPLYMAKGQVKSEMVKYIDQVYKKLQS